jgi:GntR family transcriptional regulator
MSNNPTATKLPLFRLRQDAALHDQLKVWILAGIHKNIWKLNNSLPSERVLSQSLNLSRATVRLAISELEGWLERRQGKGTYVSTAKVEQPLLKVSSFTENMQQAGVQPSSKVLKTALAHPSAKVARMLHLEEDDFIAIITRSRLADEVPIIVERSHINYSLTPKLLDQKFTGSLYKILTNVYHLKLHSGEETLEVVKAEAWVAKALGIVKDEPLLYTERLVTDPTGIPIEFAQRYSRADQCRFRVKLVGASADFTLK